MKLVINFGPEGRGFGGLVVSPMGDALVDEWGLSSPGKKFTKDSTRVQNW